ncbi:hypothetical protein EGW08_020803, partial [Elysia chlorotica]
MQGTKKNNYKLSSFYFHLQQWSIPPHWYLRYRAVTAVVLVAWLAVDMSYETRTFFSDEAILWTIFATNWSFLIIAITAVVLAVTSWVHWYKPYWIIDPIHIRAMPYSLKLQWLLYNISGCSALVVSAGYWGYVAFVSDSLLVTSHMSRLKHTANSVYVILDLFITATPIRIQHMFFTIFMASLYISNDRCCFFSLPIILLGNEHGYYFVNWKDPVEAICTCVLGLMMVVLAQFVLHFLYLMRRWIHGKYAAAYDKFGQDSEMQNIMSRSSTYSSMQE